MKNVCYPSVLVLKIKYKKINVKINKKTDTPSHDAKI
jgi:hypothetical protein